MEEPQNHTEIPAHPTDSEPASATEVMIRFGFVAEITPDQIAAEGVLDRDLPGWAAYCPEQDFRVTGLENAEDASDALLDHYGESHISGS